MLVGWSLVRGLEAIASRSEAIASRLEAIARRLEAVASRLETMEVSLILRVLRCQEELLRDATHHDVPVRRRAVKDWGQDA